MSSPSDYDCPRCGTKLRAEAAEGVEGVDLLVCIKCWGLAVQAKSMEGVVPDGVLESIEKQGLKHVEGRSCPVCPSKMVQISVPNQVVGFREVVKIDVCGDCETTWFDAGELEALQGIKPKIQEVRIEGDSEKIEPVMVGAHLGGNLRIMSGLAIIFVGIFFVSGGEGESCFFGLLGAVIALGGAVVLVTKSPEAGLSAGKCAKCGRTGSPLAWTCQRAGCDAEICTECRSAGSDPAKAYARLVGGLALTVVGGAAGIGLAMAFKTPEPLALGAIGFALFADDGEAEGDLLCHPCAVELSKLTDWRTDSAASTVWTNLHLEETRESSRDGLEAGIEKGEEKKAAAKARKAKEFLKSQTHCLHVDGKTVKRCRRMVYRKSGYCYEHQRE
ncbi:MAG: zf-TFIIB domain-containing protein [Candidatus Thalassarchaeum sp.]|nr:zf-TFIIB domain-containing protein [Candidatus Thalassarchaeum sp.]